MTPGAPFRPVGPESKYEKNEEEIKFASNDVKLQPVG